MPCICELLFHACRAFWLVGTIRVLPLICRWFFKEATPQPRFLWFHGPAGMSRVSFQRYMRDCREYVSLNRLPILADDHPPRVKTGFQPGTLRLSHHKSRWLLGWQTPHNLLGFWDMRQDLFLDDDLNFNSKNHLLSP